MRPRRQRAELLRRAADGSAVGRALALAASALCFGLAAGAGPAAAASPGLENVRSFAFAIGDGTLRGDLERRYGAYDLVIVDGEAAKRGHVDALHRSGAVVLAYLSVGTIETWRSWYRHVKRYRLEAWEDWEGEFFADTSRAGYRDAIVKRIAPAILAKGFDGLFLDNVAMIEDHRRQRAGMRQLVARLDALLGERRFLFAQNGEDALGPMFANLDGWNREDVTATYDFDRRRYAPTSPGEHRAALAALRRVRARGLLVTATDYTRRASDPLAARAVSEACAAGALPFVSNLALTRIPPTPPSCPGATASARAAPDDIRVGGSSLPDDPKIALVGSRRTLANRAFSVTDAAGEPASPTRMTWTTT